MMRPDDYRAIEAKFSRRERWLLAGAIVILVGMVAAGLALGAEPQPAPTPCTTNAAADINRDGRVDAGDQLSLLSPGTWNMPVCDATPAPIATPAPTPRPVYWDCGRQVRTDRPTRIVEASTREDLVAAATLSTRADVVILIAGELVIDRQVNFPKSDNAVVILPAGPGALIRSVQEWRGPDYIEDPPQNCISVQSWRFTIAGVRCTGYAHFGSFLKLYMPGGGTIHGCEFDGVAVRGAKWPPAASGAWSGGDKYGDFRSQVVGAHGVGPLTITSCTFRGCAVTSWDLSHVIYASGPAPSVLGCRFVDCGNPIGLDGPGMAGQQGVALLNVIESPALCPPRISSGELDAAYWRPSFVDVVPTGSSHVFAGNQVSGLVSAIYDGRFSPGAALDANDLRGVRLHPFWFPAGREPAAIHMGVGYLSWPEWLAKGYDVRSQAPRGAAK